MSVLSTVLKSEKNIAIVEKNIKSKTSTEDEYKWVLYQTLGNLMMNPDLKSRVDSIKKGEIGWQDSMYAQYRAKIQEHDEYLENPFEVVDGVLTCPKCKGEKAYTWQLQTRSGDESMTTFATCVKCSHRWTYSG